MTDVMLAIVQVWGVIQLVGSVVLMLVLELGE